MVKIKCLAVLSLHCICPFLHSSDSNLVPRRGATANCFDVGDSTFGYSIGRWDLKLEIRPQDLSGSSSGIDPVERLLGSQVSKQTIGFTISFQTGPDADIVQFHLYLIVPMRLMTAFQI